MAANAVNGLIYSKGKWVNKELHDANSILVLNLMPMRETTELQFLTAFDDLDDDFELTFLFPKSHHFLTTPRSEVAENYVSLDQIQNDHFDGLIITGSPIETLPFNQVDYWPELGDIIDWATTHVTEKLYECWAAQAGLYYNFGIKKRCLATKLFGIFPADQIDITSSLIQGLTNPKHLKFPQSRHTEILIDSGHLPEDLKVVASSREAGPIILQSLHLHTTYVTGHPEYSEDTLAKEYHRDINKGLPINKPQHYFESGTDIIDYSWAQSSKQFYQNWTKQITNKKVGLSI